jgi:AbrB family looped-hinge helix DNA binding protein
MIKRKITPMNGYSFINIPKEIFDELGLKFGQKMDFDVKDGKVIMTPLKFAGKE